MSGEIKGYYNPRYYHKSQLYQIVKENLTEFLRVYPEQFEKEYGELRPEVEKSFYNFLKCGCPDDGFAKYECPDCQGFFIVPFSCKNWICPSCSEKRVIDWSAWLIQEVLYDMPHYFMTFTMPIEIRKYFFQNRGLIKYLEKNIADMLSYYLRKNCEKTKDCSDSEFYNDIQLKKKKRKSEKVALCDAVPGIVIVPQTFGERLNPNIHFHLLCSTQCIDERGGFWNTHLPNYFEMRMVWRNKVLSLLLNMKVITQKEFTNFRLKYPKGFNFHISEPEKNNFEQSRKHILENIGKYMVRTPLSEAKIIEYEKIKKTVTIRYKQYEFDHEGKLVRLEEFGFETMNCLELLARLSLHIPQPYRHKVKYYGAYSTRFRGAFKAAGNKPNNNALNIDRLAAKQTWAQLIFKVYQDNPLKCPECGAKLKLSELISPKDARRELRSLKLKTQYTGKNGFLIKEQYQEYCNTS